MIRKTLFAVLLMALVGCLGTNRNPYENRAQTQPWWQASTAGVTSNNPWMAFVKPHVTPNQFDPWANDDLQRYSASPIVSSCISQVGSVAPVNSKAPAKKIQDPAPCGRLFFFQ